MGAFDDHHTGADRMHTTRFFVSTGADGLHRLTADRPADAAAVRVVPASLTGPAPVELPAGPLTGDELDAWEDGWRGGRPGYWVRIG